MILGDMSKPLTSRFLNETSAKRFGKKLNLREFSDEQLYDSRNRLRTRLHRIETTESYNSLNTDESYHRNKMFLDIINAEITERENNKIYESLDADAPAGDWIKDFQKSDDPKFKGKSKDERKKMALAAKREKQKESVSRSGRRLIETEEQEAELIMAAKDMVDKLTGWMEHTSEMQNETMLTLGDAIRMEKGSRESQEFINIVKPALDTLYDTMQTTRNELINGVGMLTGQNPTQMGADSEPGMDSEQPIDLDGDDGFGASDAAKGGSMASGRERRESVEWNRKLKTLLDSKKK